MRWCCKESQRTSDLGGPRPREKDRKNQGLLLFDDRVQPRKRAEEEETEEEDNKGRDTLGTYILGHHHRVPLDSGGPLLDNNCYYF